MVARAWVLSYFTAPTCRFCFIQRSSNLTQAETLEERKERDTVADEKIIPDNLTIYR